MKEGKLVVLTAPLTEMIDHAGYFIQMAMASIPIWMEGVINRKYPEWKNVRRFPDGSALAVPAGLRVVETVMEQEFGADNVAVCYPADLDQFLGPATRVVAVSTHNPLGVTFAAGVYTSIFGSSKRPMNAHCCACARRWTSTQISGPQSVSTPWSRPRRSSRRWSPASTS